MRETRNVAVVTGGAGAGIGHGITEALLEDGWNVVITDRQEKRGRAFRERHHKSEKQLELVVTDVIAPEAPEQVVRIALERFGRLDGLVNNVGVGLAKQAGEISDEEFFTLFNVDFMASFRFVRAALPELVKTKGSIVNIGSIHALRSAQKYALYGATKAALGAFTRGLAVDYGKDGLRANIVHPGLVESPQNEALLANLVADPKQWIDEFTKKKQCIPRVITAHDVGKLVAFLLGDNSRLITGQSIYIDGGTTSLLWNNE